MSKQVDLEKPISDDDREYLKQRSRYDDIEENDRQFKNGKFAEDFEEEFSPNYTVAAPPIEPGSDADNPPKFVGNRPYGVDRAVWGGSTGLSEEEGVEATAPEPHSNIGATDDDPRWAEPKLANPESTQTASDATDKKSGSVDAGPFEEVPVEDLTVEELRNELRERELPTDGNKADLQKRLKKALKDEEQG